MGLNTNIYTRIIYYWSLYMKVLVGADTQLYQLGNATDIIIVLCLHGFVDGIESDSKNVRTRV